MREAAYSMMEEGIFHEGGKFVNGEEAHSMRVAAFQERGRLA